MQKKRIMKWLGICAGIMVCGLTQQVIFADENEETIIEGETIVEEESVQNAEMEASDPSVEYCSHVAEIGWQLPVSDGQVSGTTGQGLAMEAIEIELSDSSIEGGIEYSVLISDEGWQAPVSGGEMAGTTGEGRPLEAVQIWLNGQINEYYDIYYQPHVANVGWLGWAKNGQKAGSQGYGYSLEALKIKLLEKRQQIENEKEAFLVDQLQVQAHVSNIGWMEPVKENEMAGTTGRSQSIEAIKVNLNDPVYSGDVEYSAYVSGIGWQSPVSHGDMAGTVGKAKPIEAIQIALTGEMANQYDIYYQTHVSNIGWLGWAKNGEAAGTIEYGSKLEALYIQLVEKGKKGPTSSLDPLYYHRLTGQAHVSNIGWMEAVKENEMLGTTGQGLAMEAFRLNVSNLVDSGNIQYTAYVSGLGWQSLVSGGKMAGTVGKAKPIEAIQIALTGEMANHYDIYYQTHVSNRGWLGWAKNGEAAGTIEYGCNLEAFLVQLVEKGRQGPTSPIEPLYQNCLVLQAHISNVGWKDPVREGEVAGTERGFSIEAFRLGLKETGYSGGLAYRSHIADMGWEDWKGNSDISGTTGQSRAVQAIQIHLSGEISNHYDIIYRTYVFGIGWMRWAINGSTSGTEGLNIPIQALQVRLLKKHSGIEDANSVTNLYGSTGYQNGNVLTGWQEMGYGDYYFDSAGTMVTGQIVDGRYLGSSGKVVDFYELSNNLKSYLYGAAYDGEDWAVSIIFKDEILDIYSHQMQSASVMKLFVMGTIYDNYAEMIQLYGQDVVDANLYSMITVSDNDAWKRLRAFLGYGDEEAGCRRINNWAVTQGYYDTYNSSAAYQNYTSTHDSAKIIYDMYNHRFSYSEAMLSLLRQQTRTWKIPAGIPEGVPTGNKTGELENCENDAAIVWAPYGPFMLSVMSYNVQYTGYAQAMIRQIASAVYDWLSVY